MDGGIERGEKEEERSRGWKCAHNYFLFSVFHMFQAAVEIFAPQPASPRHKVRGQGIR